MRLQSRLLVLAAAFLPFTIPSAKSQTRSPAQFVTATTIGSTPYVILGTADFNGDGRQDILTRANAGLIGVLLQNSDGTFTEHDTTISANGGTSIADVNGDGKPDILTTYGSPQSCPPPNDPVGCTDTGPATLNVFLGNGDGTFRSLTPVNMTDGADTSTPLVADLNGDGALDVAVTIGDNSSDTLQVLLNNGTGVFHLLPSPNPAIFATLLAAGDFRGNGKVDLVVAGAVCHYAGP